MGHRRGLERGRGIVQSQSVMILIEAENMLSLGQRIKARRVLCWMSQEEFALSAGVSRRQVAYWESDSDTPSAERIPDICNALRISADWLLTGKGWLKDVHDSKFYAERKEQHLARSSR